MSLHKSKITHCGLCFQSVPPGTETKQLIIPVRHKFIRMLRSCMCSNEYFESMSCGKSCNRKACRNIHSSVLTHLVTEHFIALESMSIIKSFFAMTGCPSLADETSICRNVLSTLAPKTWSIANCMSSRHPPP